MTAPPEARLPDGTRIFTVHPREVAPLYKQVQEYCRCGIQVNDGDIVFDVGANIGLFALWLRHSVNRKVTVYSFEPIPVVFDALKHNAERFDPRNWKVFDCALGRCSGTLTFDYCTHVTAMSSAYPDTSVETVVSMRNTLMRNVNHLPSGLRWLRYLPRFLLRRFLDSMLRLPSETEKVECPVRTISEIIRQEDVRRIDLLKIDVEKAELDVLEGIADPDWSIIRQMVIEVHDLDNRLAKVTELLRKNGFDAIEVEQEPLFRGSDIYALYARRKYLAATN
jgi:FkbM family methyltransferase